MKHPLVQLRDAVDEAEPLLRHYENQLASSLSSDSRSHDGDRDLRQQLLNILEALKAARSEVVVLTSEEAKRLYDVLWEARSDIWQTARVSESNLTGKDPVFPDDEPRLPIVTRLITRAGLDASYKVHANICAVQKEPGGKIRTTTV